MLFRSWHVPAPLDFEGMVAEARAFVGGHDFASFAANRGTPSEDTFRTMEAVRIRQSGRCLTIEVEGDGFLYKMVRLLTGTIVRVAEKRAPITFITDLLDTRVKARTHFMAVAGGLCLARVFY